MDNGPYLSIVAATRNDNHGGDLNHRTQIFIDGVAAQAARHKLPVELILVEWNPPEDRPPLAEAFEWPAPNPWCEIRIITVPSEVHRRYRYGDKLPMFQMIAKNVGVRRARGEFVLQTNIDIVFSDAVFAFLAKRELRAGEVYRCDRVDVCRDVPLAAPLDEQLAYCATHVLRVARRDGMWIVPDDALERTVAAVRLVEYRDPWDYRRRGDRTLRKLRAWWQRGPRRKLAAVGRDRRRKLAAVHRNQRALAVAVWWRLNAYLERSRLHLNSPQYGLREYVFSLLAWLLVAARSTVLSLLRLARTLLLLLVLSLLGLARNLVRLFFIPPLRAVSHSRILRFFLRDLSNARARLWRLGYAPTPGELLDELELQKRRVPAVHSNACGDFILTDRTTWDRMRGSPELAIFSFHLDSLTLITAIKAGGALVDLAPAQVIYHIEHGSGWTPEHNLSMYRRINRAGIPVLSNGGYARYATNLLRDPKYFLATEEWGLAQMKLPEIVVTRRLEPDPKQSDREECAGGEPAAATAA